MVLDAVKKCSKCLHEKIASENFLWVKTRWHSWCHDCRKSEKTKWNEANKEKIASYMVDYHKRTYEIHKEKKIAYVIEWQRANKEKSAAKRKRWYEANKEKSFARSAIYRASKRNACPPWLSESMKQQIEEIYAEARKISNESGVMHEVDHIIPLKSDVVCGLHVPWNLQVISQFKNRNKRNNLESQNG